MSQQHQMLIQRQYKQQQNTWKLLVVSLMNVLSIGIPLARNCQNDDYHSIWSPLGSVLEDILFPKKFVISFNSIIEIIILMINQHFHIITQIFYNIYI